jgi:uncharacterized protein YeaO (DUF488 family)
LGSDRGPGEGLRIGAVRRPPRGVRKTEYASKNFYDVWLPTLAPSAAAVALARSAATQRQWLRFVARYRREMGGLDARSVIGVLAALSHDAAFSLGCYCAEEARCHRSVLREILLERGAALR